MPFQVTQDMAVLKLVDQVGSSTHFSFIISSPINGESTLNGAAIAAEAALFKVEQRNGEKELQLQLHLVFTGM